VSLALLVWLHFRKVVVEGTLQSRQKRILTIEEFHQAKAVYRVSSKHWLVVVFTLVDLQAGFEDRGELAAEVWIGQWILFNTSSGMENGLNHAIEDR
jgi:hypothetical protein